MNTSTFKPDFILSLFSESLTSDLADNIAARNVLAYIEKENKLPEAAFIANINWDADPQSIILKFPSSNEGDYLKMRINHLMLKGIRRYGIFFGSEMGLSSGFYGINLNGMNDYGNMPVSAIIMGNNGTGKSSLYCALERIGKGTCRLAELKGYDDFTRQSNFLKHANCEDEECEIQLIYDNSLFVQTSPDDIRHTGFTHEACFCSEFDVQSMEKNENFTDFILSQIGLLPLKELTIRLDGAIALLSNEITGEEAKGDDGDKEKVESLKKRISLIRQLKSACEKNLNRYLADRFDDIRDMVTSILDVYLEKTDETKESIIFELAGDVIRFEIKFETEGRSIAMPLRRYLNTFRFKLFIFALKLALGLFMKIDNGVDFPYVVDDMFDSSDFHNRVGIGDFFSATMKKHDELLDSHIKKCSSDKGLTAAKKRERISFLRGLRKPQLIFFTQDELIADSLFESLRQSQQIRLTRLFNPDEVTEDDIVEGIYVCKQKGGLTAVNFNYANLYQVIKDYFE